MNLDTAVRVGVAVTATLLVLGGVASWLLWWPLGVVYTLGLVGLAAFGNVKAFR